MNEALKGLFDLDKFDVMNESIGQPIVEDVECIRLFENLDVLLESEDSYITESKVADFLKVSWEKFVAAALKIIRLIIDKFRGIDGNKEVEINLKVKFDDLIELLHKLATFGHEMHGNDPPSLDEIKEDLKEAESAVGKIKVTVTLNQIRDLERVFKSFTKNIERTIRDLVAKGLAMKPNDDGMDMLGKILKGQGMLDEHIETAKGKAKEMMDKVKKILPDVRELLFGIKRLVIQVLRDAQAAVIQAQKGGAKTESFEDIFDIDIFSESASGTTITTEGLAKLMGVSITGGDKESPSNSGHKDGYAKVAIPGGEKESPSTSGYNDGFGKISIPAGATIDQKTYNTALVRLQQSFKEGYETIEILRSVNVVEEDVNISQEDFEQEMLEQAMFESYINGPYFESSNAENKDKIKEVVGKIQDEIEGGGPHNLLPSRALRKLFGRGAAIKAKAWQTVGIFYTTPSQLSSALKDFEKEFGDKLDGLKLSAGKLKYDTGMTNPHVKSAWGWGLLVALFIGGPLVSKLMMGPMLKASFGALANVFAGGGMGAKFWALSAASTAATAATGVATSQVVGSQRAKKQRRIKKGVPYILVVTSEGGKMEDVEVKLTKEDEAKVEKNLGSKEAPKELKEFVEMYSESYDGEAYADLFEADAGADDTGLPEDSDEKTEEVEEENECGDE